ncbi:MAG: NAD-dependent epimerase/dehydratase family protein [Marinobacter sp.]
MNYLITGGTGFIGSALCLRLLQDKHDIVVLTRHPDVIKARTRVSPIV